MALINLTMANHVLLIHPMNAESMERACTFEMQAIGRARRWGQPSPVVHVWRFFTLQTVEEELTRAHQAERWRRWDEAARVAAAEDQGGTLAVPVASGTAAPAPT